MVKIKQDSEFLFAALNGNQKAIEYLVKSNERLVRNVVRKALPNSIYEDDIVQEILTRAISKLNTFQHDSAFTTWLYRLSMNYVVDFIRKKKLLTVAISDVNCRETEQYREDDLKGLMHKYFEVLIVCLREDYQIVIILADIFKMQHQDAARYLNITPANFRKRLSRARLQMKAMICTGNVTRFGSGNGQQNSLSAALSLANGDVSLQDRIRVRRFISSRMNGRQSSLEEFQ